MEFGKPGASFSSATIELYDEEGSSIPISVQPVEFFQADNTLVFAPEIAINSGMINGLDTYVKVVITNVVTNGQTEDFEYEVLLIPEEYTEPSVIESSANCSGTGGSASLTDTHGYKSIQWSNGDEGVTEIENLAAGDYDVTITDKLGCETVYPFTIEIEDTNQPIAEINPDGPTSFCEGESVTLVAGGDGSYSWSSGSNAESIDVIESGTYYLSVENDLGCQDVTSIDVTVYEKPSANIVVDGALEFCHGESVFLIAEGGTDYEWNTGSEEIEIEVFETGTYVVIATDDNECTDIANVSVTVWDNPIVEILPNGPVAFCPGGSVELSTELDGAYTWSDGSDGSSIEVAESGEYILTVTDENSCVGTDALEVVVFPNPVLETIAGNINSTAGELEVYECDGEVSSTFEWSLDGGVIQGMDNEKSVSVIWDEGITDGKICVMEIDTNSCESKEVCLFVALMADHVLDEKEFKISIFPNPVTQHLFIRANDLQIGEIHVMKMTGERMSVDLEQDGMNGRKFDVRAFSPGIYILGIESNGEFYQSVFVVQ